MINKKLLMTNKGKNKYQTLKEIKSNEIIKYYV